MHVLIIGGTRFVGRHIVEELLAQDHRVSVLNRGVSPDPLPDEVVRLRADRTKPEEVRAALDGQSFDAVVDCIGYAGEEMEVAIDIFGGRIERYVYISSVSVYQSSELLPLDETWPLQGESGWEYAMGKVECERALQAAGEESGFPWVSLRPAYIYGPYNNNPNAEFIFFARVEQGRKVLVPGDGSFIFHHTHGRDLAHATLAALTRDEAVGHAYNITGAYAQTANRFVRAVGEAMDRELEIVHAPGMTRRGDAGRFFFYQTRPTQVYSIERARRDLAWEPRYDIVDGLRDSYRWYTEVGYAADHPFDFSYDDEVLATLGE